jgi:hypothetical protein
MFEATHLLSTPSSFGRNFAGEHFLIEQIISNVGDARFFAAPGPFEHHFYVLVVPVNETATPGVMAWSSDPDDVASLLSLFFGKRVLHQGPIHLSFGWMLPDLLTLQPNPYHALPFYGGSHASPPVQDPDWQTLSQIEHIFDVLAAKPGQRPAGLVAAARCYAESLRLLPIDRELAYVRLVQAIESVASKATFSDLERFAHDDELRAHLEWLEGLQDRKGRKVATFMRRRLYQVKRTVWLWLEKHLRLPFFIENGLSPDTIQQAIAAAYDLRSLYVHTGLRFGDWIDPVEGRCGNKETVPQGFADICKEKSLRRLLRSCPTYVGLERLVRYTLHVEMHSL